MDPFLANCTDIQQIIIITAFAARVGTGHYGKGHTVQVPTVTKALPSISKTIKLAGEQSPQLALPIIVPEECQNAGERTHNPFKQTIGDLAIIAFYYLLRVGEYTKPRMRVINGKEKRVARTVQFSVANIGFFKNIKILTRHSPLKTLLKAESCTLKITNQKNG